MPEFTIGEQCRDCGIGFYRFIAAGERYGVSATAPPTPTIELRFPGMVPLPIYAHDEQGANGWEWRMAWLLREMAGQEALNGAKAAEHNDLGTRDFHQWRERILDSIASRIERELPEIQP